MLRRCTWHKKYFGFVRWLGEKEPLSDHGITDTLCPRCLEIEMLGITVGQMERATKRLRRAKELIAPTFTIRSEITTIADADREASRILKVHKGGR